MRNYCNLVIVYITITGEVPLLSRGALIPITYRRVYPLNNFANLKKYSKSFLKQQTDISDQWSSDRKTQYRWNILSRRLPILMSKVVNYIWVMNNRLN